MRALVYHGPRNVSVDQVPDAAIEKPTDGTFFFKGQSMGTGQANVKQYNRQLRNLIHAGVARPSFIVSHRVGLDEAPSAYKHFDNRDDGWTKVLLKPGRNGGSPG